MKRTARSQLTATLATLLGLLVLAASAASAPVGEKGKPKQQGCEVEAEGSLSDKRSFELEAELEDGRLEGELEFRDKTKDGKLDFESTTITNLVVAGKIASVQGRGKTESSSGLGFSASLDEGKKTFALRLSSGYTFEGGFAGKKGKIELEGTCPFDGNATVLLDAARKVSATIGPAGGSLATGAVTLTIPAGALSEDELITITPITDLADSPLSLSLIGAVKLEPEGLRFLKPALLSIPLPTGVPPASVIGFGSAGDGSDLHLEPRTIAGGTITLELWHFSTGGAASGGGAAVQTYTPSTSEQQAQQRIAAAGAACAAEQAAGTLGGPACANLQQQIEGALTDWYENTVRPGLQQAVGAPPSQIVAAIAEWHHWQRQVEDLLNDLQGPCGSLQSRCDEARGLAKDAVADLARRRLNECTGTNLGAQLAALALIADFMVAAGITALPSDIPADLLRACAHLEIEVLDFPAVAALFYANTLRGRVTVDVHNGPNRTDVPHTLTVGGAALGTAADGSFETTLTPTTTPLSVTLEAAANATSLQNTSFSGQTLLVRQARARIELVALNPTTIEPGEAVTLRARVAGDGMDGGTVTYANQGVGSLGASSGTTNPDGEAPVFVYEAPADTGGDTTVTATFGDASDSVTIDVEAPITVTISPAAATVSTGDTRQFSATVTGTPNTAVQWSATGGTISQAGLYTAGSSAGNFTVRATSVADSSKSDSASVTVTAAGRVTFLGADAEAGGGASYHSGDPHEPPVSQGESTIGNPESPTGSGGGSGNVSGLCHPALGGGASASGSGSFNYSAAGGTNLTRISVAAGVSASSNAANCSVGGGANARAIVIFEVSGATVAYTANFSSSASGATTGCGNAGAGGQLRGPFGPIRSADGSGTLGPGVYSLEALGAACANNGAAGAFSASGSAQITFTP